jgi:hypothetical protein
MDQVMKDKNCMDPKMAAYCQAVRKLEGMFHGLELHHVLRDYNKAADVLAKTTSSRKPVPHGFFASDQHAPSVRVEGEKPPKVKGPEVMAIDQPPELNLEDPDWRFRILEWLVEGKLPSNQTEARRIARRAKAFFLIESELYVDVSTYDPQAYGPTPFSPRGFPRFLSIRTARGLHMFVLPPLTT